MCTISIGERIKYYRKLLGISRSYLAEGSFTKAYIKLIESNKRRVRTTTASIIVDKLNKIAKEKGIDLDLTLSELYISGDKYIELLCSRKLKECDDKDNYIDVYLDILDLAQKYSINSIMVKAYEQLSIHYYKTGDYNQAINYSKNKLTICYDLNLHNEIADSLNKIGVFYYVQKDYNTAIFYYMQGYEFLIHNNIKESLIYVKLIYNIALAYSVICKVQEAIKYLEILNKIKDIPEPYKTNMLILKASLLIDLENYEGALNIFENLVYDCSENIYIIQNNMGLIFSRIGKFEESIKYYTESINGQLKEPTANMTISLINLSNVYALENKKKIAIIFIEHAIKNAIDFNQDDYIIKCLDILENLYSGEKEKIKLYKYLDKIISMYGQRLNDLKVLSAFEKLK